MKKALKKVIKFGCSLRFFQKKKMVVISLDSLDKKESF